MLLHKVIPAPSTGTATGREAVATAPPPGARTELDRCRNRLMALLGDWAAPRPVVWLLTAPPALRQQRGGEGDAGAIAAPTEDEILLALSDAESGEPIAHPRARGFAHVVSYRVRSVEGLLLLPEAAAPACGRPRRVPLTDPFPLAGAAAAARIA